MVMFEGEAVFEVQQDDKDKLKVEMQWQTVTQDTLLLQFPWRDL